jgi:hypothetical protein
MSTETKPVSATPTADRSVELVNKLLKLPEQTRIDLAQLLLDSVRQGFTSLEEAEKRDKDLIKSRIDQLVKGEVQLLDANEVVTNLKRRYSKEKSS